MTLKNNRAPLLSNIKLYVSLLHHMWIQTGVTVRKRLSWVMTSVTLIFDLWPWPFVWTSLLSLVITPENFLMIRWWEHSQKGVTDRQTDRRTDWTIHRAAWSQLKIEIWPLIPMFIIYMQDGKKKKRKTSCAVYTILSFSHSIIENRKMVMKFPFPNSQAENKNRNVIRYTCFRFLFAIWKKEKQENKIFCRRRPLLFRLVSFDRIWWLYASTLVEWYKQLVLQIDHWSWGSNQYAHVRETTHIGGLKNNLRYAIQNAIQHLWGNIMFFILC